MSKTMEAELTLASARPALPAQAEEAAAQPAGTGYLFVAAICGIAAMAAIKLALLRLAHPILDFSL